MINDSKTIARISIFTALVIVLQVIATFINFGSFPICLTLIPIIVGGCVYGPLVGAWLGLMFGVVVDVMVIVGADPSGASMLVAHPIITLTACLLKGTLAGLISSLIFKYKSDKLGLLIASALCPIINTLILILALILFFDGGFKLLIGTFVSVNFLIELLINILIAPRLYNLIVRNKERFK